MTSPYDKYGEVIEVDDQTSSPQPSQNSYDKYGEEVDENKPPEPTKEEPKKKSFWSQFVDEATSSELSPFEQGLGQVQRAAIVGIGSAPKNIADIVQTPAKKLYEAAEPLTGFKLPENTTPYLPESKDIENFVDEYTAGKFKPVGEADERFQEFIRDAISVPGGRGIIMAAAGQAVKSLAQLGGVSEEGQQNAKHVAMLLSFLKPKEIQGLFKSVLPSAQAAQVEAKILGGQSAPKSGYNTAEEALGKLKNSEQAKVNPTPRLQAELPSTRQQTPQGKELAVSKDGKDVGIRPKDTTPPTEVSEKVGNIFSKDKFYNTTEGGQSVVQQVRKADKESYQKVNDLYKKSEEANEAIQTVHPELVDQLVAKVAEIEKIPHPSGPQNQLKSALQDIIKNLAEVDAEAGITGYKPISNQTLIKQVQSLRQKLDFDFTHGNPKGIFKPTIRDISNSIEKAAEASGDTKAINSLKEANKGYSEWSQTFDNQYIRPLRDQGNLNFPKMFKDMLDIGETNLVRNILKTSKEGVALEGKLTRELVDKNLKKYFDDPRKANAKDFNTSLRELEAVITPEQSTAIKSEFEQARKSALAGRKVTYSPIEKKTAKYLDKQPEYIQSKMNSRTGIKELREDLGTQHKSDFNELATQKMRSMLREGNIEKEFTGNDLYKVLNDEKNFEIFSEIIGEEASEAYRLAAKNAGKNQLRLDAFTKGIKNIAGFKFLHKILYF